MSETDPSSPRVLFRDLKPYEAPQSLAELRGPDGGRIRLTHSVLWAPGDGTIDLDQAGGTVMAYEAVLSEGNAPDQVGVLNRERLIRVWGELVLPPRVRDLWEGRFTELGPHGAAGERLRGRPPGPSAT